MSAFIGNNRLSLKGIVAAFVGSQKVYTANATVTLAGTLSATYGYATIGGVKRSAVGSYTVKAGDHISIYVSSASTTYRSHCQVTLNGEVVKSGYGTYDFTVPHDCTVTFTQNAVGTSNYYTAAIVT